MPSQVRILLSPLDAAVDLAYVSDSAGIAQLARASAFQAEGRGFESRFPLCSLALGRTGARVAQSVERVHGKHEVTGSIPRPSAWTADALAN